MAIRREVRPMSEVETRAKKAKARIHVIYGSATVSHGVATEIAGAVGSSDGAKTWRIFHQSQQVKAAVRKIQRWYRDGKLQDQIDIVPVDGGKKIGVLQVDDLTLISSLPHLKGPHAETDRWETVASVDIRFRDFNIGDVQTVVEVFEDAGSPLLILAILKGVLETASRYLALAESVAPGGLAWGAEYTAMSEAEDGVAGGVIESEAGEFAISSVTAGAFVMGGIFLVAGLIVEGFLSNVMNHRVRIYNGTSFDVHWQIAHIDAGQVTSYPQPSTHHDRKGRVGTAGTLKAVSARYIIWNGKKYRIPGSDKGESGPFAIVTSDFDEGVGYIVKLTFNDPTGQNRQLDPVFAKMVVPYWGKNHIALIPESHHVRNAQEAWDYEADDRKLTRIHRQLSLPSVHASLTMDKLEDEQESALDNKEGYYYHSILYLEEKGVWHGKPPGEDDLSS